MNKTFVLVTGANGFIGSQLVRTLLHRGFRVRAAVHQLRSENYHLQNPMLEWIKIDISDRSSLTDAFKRVDHVYHFAAKVNDKLSRQELHRVNVQGTRNIWEMASQTGVKKALYCSTTAVYGLLCGSQNMIDEHTTTRAVEAYGKSKLEGEKIVREISSTRNLDFIIMRPTAVFGPGDHTHFGKQLRTAAFSKLLLSAGFKNKKFSYVHVEDVASAAIHLMQYAVTSDPVYNIAVDQPISYDEAFAAYLRVLDHPGFEYLKLRWLGKLSAIVDQMPEISGWLSSRKKLPFAFKIWKPGFDMTYSSKKLLATSFQFHWTNFEDILSSCLNEASLIPL